MAIDYGTKRTGLAVTDPTQLIATALETVPTREAINYIINYSLRENIEGFIVGMPRHLNNTDADIVPEINQFIAKLQAHFPETIINAYDERFTSLMAKHSMIESGQSKKTRRDKSMLDKISATILLQSWLEKQQYKR